MDAFYLLVTVALFLAFVGLGLMIWAVRSRQFNALKGVNAQFLREIKTAFVTKNRPSDRAGEKKKENN